MMKRCMLLVLAVSITLFAAESMAVSYRLPVDKIQYTNEDGYNVIHIPGCTYPYQIGKPMIPVIPVVYLIPPDARVTGVKIVSTKMEKMVTVSKLKPVQYAPAFTKKLPPPPFVEPTLQCIL